jgi:hypothetical protein
MGMSRVAGIVFLLAAFCGQAQASLVFTITQLPSGPINIGSSVSFQVSAHSTTATQTLSAFDLTIALSNAAGEGGQFTGGASEVPGTGNFFDPFPNTQVDYSWAPNPNLTITNSQETPLVTLTLGTTGGNVEPGNYSISLSGLLALDGGSNNIPIDPPASLNYSLAFSPVPEPSSLICFSIATLGCYGIRRRKRKSLQPIDPPTPTSEDLVAGSS